ncbi:unnamed protein product [Caenorhabditis angaria]|uniref:D-lactate dehydratase n=1 Tax=Caenorhabditis angaria TaxID=860376 RepID=A0A9P1IBA2_9PELO|nr:unnamed protein product [Caenorhabditis angaria]
MSGKTAIILLAPEGAEEMEAVITGDVLVRAGVQVQYVGLEANVKCSRGIRVIPDVLIDDVKEKLFDLVVLPGGQPGSNLLAANETVGSILKSHIAAGKYVAAICAAPLALKAHGIKVELLTSHPSVKKTLEEAGYKYSEDRVVVSNNVITSRGPGTSFEFALKLVELLVGEEKSKSLIDPMVLKL